MSNLSSRVMNMKFMSKDSKDKSKEEEKVKVKDSSEWVLPKSAILLKRAKASNVVQNVGYASVNSFANANSINDNEVPIPTARKTWGAPTVSKQQMDVPKIELTRLKDSVNKKKSKVTSSEQTQNLASNNKKRNNSEKELLASNKRRFTQT